MREVSTVEQARARLKQLEDRYGCSARLEFVRATVWPEWWWERPYHYVTLAGGNLAYGTGSSREFRSDRIDAVLEMVEAWTDRAHAKWLEQHAPEAVQ